MVITGINHLTLAVRDLERSFAFYVDVLGLKPAARWAHGAYLLAGEDWICLSLDAHTRHGPLPEYTHLALSTRSEHFHTLADALRTRNATFWKDNRSEGDSLYFLDPDGHKLEIHLGDLDSRLAALAEQPYEDLVRFV